MEVRSRKTITYWIVNHRDNGKGRPVLFEAPSPIVPLSNSVPAGRKTFFTEFRIPQDACHATRLDN